MKINTTHKIALAYLLGALLFLPSCTSNKETKLLLGTWQMSFEKSWNKQINLLDKTNRRFFDRLPLNNKKKRMDSYQQSVENIKLVFKNDKTLDFLAEKTLMQNKNWEVVKKDELPFLLIENENQQVDVFEILQLTENTLILKVDELNHKVVLNKIEK